MIILIYSLKHNTYTVINTCINTYINDYISLFTQTQHISCY